jgi:hypothetical protein
MCVPIEAPQTTRAYPNNLAIRVFHGSPNQRSINASACSKFRRGLKGKIVGVAGGG